MKKINFLIAAIIVTTGTTVWAQSDKKDCTYTIKESRVNVKWEAYKTPMKIGVGGKFKTVKILSEKEGKSIIDIVKAGKLEIDTSSVDTKDKGRDLKISKSFFSTMEGGPVIKLATKSIDTDKIIMAVTMNGVTRDVPMSYNEQNGNFQASGVVDVLDFAMSDELAALTKACFQKHEGKTWSDVNVELAARFTRKCD